MNIRFHFSKQENILIEENISQLLFELEKITFLR